MSSSSWKRFRDWISSPFRRESNGEPDSDVEAQLLPHGEPDSDVEAQLLLECQAMIRFASGTGLLVPTAAVEAVYQDQDYYARKNTSGGTTPTRAQLKKEALRRRELVDAHRKLTTLINPATPRTALVLMEEAPRGPVGKLLGPTRLLRALMVFAATLLVTFVLLLAFSDAGGATDPVQAAITSESNWRSLWSALYILSAAGLGAAFAGLFKANRELTEGTFEPMKESSYWVTIVLGLIAGVFLAHVLPSDIGALGELTKPLLALLGGFSAPAVHRVLSRLVETLEALVKGDSQELISARERELRIQAANEVAGARVGLAAKLAELDKALGSDGIPEESRERVRALLNEFLPPRESL